VADSDLAGLEERLGHRFAERSLLGQALTHASATAADAPDNERLEFLGDAVVGLAVCDYIYRCFTKCEEGALTKMKSLAVSAAALARRARALDLPRYASLGRGMPAPDSLSDAVLANLFEGVVGAVYLDAGFERAAEFVIGQLDEEIEAAAESRGEWNRKAILQQLASRRFGELPKYRVVSTTGPAHGKVFEIEAVVGGQAFPVGRGRSKKEAEQRAASNAIAALGAECTGAEEERGEPGA